MLRRDNWRQRTAHFLTVVNVVWASRLSDVS